MLNKKQMCFQKDIVKIQMTTTTKKNMDTYLENMSNSYKNISNI